ncbi:MAG: cyanophycinase [Planctomycetota bacterium]|nr:cyanophycinase [Planctomycetota bacterium]
MVLKTVTLLLVTLAVLVVEDPTPAAPKSGVLIVAGGGSLPADLRPRALELAGGHDADILIVPWASRREEAGSATVAVWQEAGATRVTVIPDDATEARKAIEDTDLMWLVGGSQVRLMDAFRERDLIEAVRKSHSQGTIIAGTSAGAAVMSRYMMTGKAELKSLTPDSTELVEGLGLWPQVIVDQHFLARQRWARLFTAVASHPDQIGVGIDEQTAVIVDPDGSWQVLGRGPVVVIEVRNSKAKSSASLATSDFRVAFIAGGERWNPDQPATTSGGN